MTIGLFWGKKDTEKKLNPTQELREPPTKHTQVLTHDASPIIGSESTVKTLDDIGIPPPPPSSSSNKERKKLFSEKLKLKPLKHQEGMAETSEPELPEDYNERAKEVHGDSYTPTDDSGNIIHEKEIITHTIEKKLSEKAMKKIDKMDESIKSFKDKISDEWKELKSEVKLDIKGFLAEHKEFRKENSMLTAINQGLEDSNKKFMKENKMLMDKLDSLAEHFDEMIKEQEESQKTINKIHSYLDPIIEREKKIISDNEKIAKKAIQIHEESQKILDNSKEMKSLNFEYQEKIDAFARILMDVHHDHKEFPLIKDKISVITEELSNHKKLLKPLEKSTYETEIDALKEELKCANAEIKSLSSAVKKSETKIVLLRERIDHYKKIGRISHSETN